MNPQELSARGLAKSISLLPPRERGNVSSRTQSPTLVLIRYTPTDPRSGGMNPQEPSARGLDKSISLLPPRERGNVSSRTQSPHTCSNPLQYNRSANQSQSTLHLCNAFEVARPYLFLCDSYVIFCYHCNVALIMVRLKLRHRIKAGEFICKPQK